jgi:hypothetical protein
LLPVPQAFLFSRPSPPPLILLWKKSPGMSGNEDEIFAIISAINRDAIKRTCQN